MDDVVRMDVVLTAIEDFEFMNSAYAGGVLPPLPARTTVAGPARVEITVLAVTEDKDG